MYRKIKALSSDLSMLNTLRTTPGTTSSSILFVWESLLSWKRKNSGINRLNGDFSQMATWRLEPFTGDILHCAAPRATIRLGLSHANLEFTPYGRDYNSKGFAAPCGVLVNLVPRVSPRPSQGSG